MSLRLLLVVLVIGIPRLAHPQVVELELGGGYVVGGGAENPGPSLPTFDVGVVVWPWSRWGLALRLVEGPGEDLYDPPVPGDDRTWLGQAKLHYWTVNGRHRWPVTPKSSVEAGFGLMLDGRFATVTQFNDPALGRRVVVDTTFGGFSLDALVTRALGRYFAVKGGLTYDFNFETSNFQPVVLASIRY